MTTNHDENRNNKSSFKLSKRLYFIDFERYETWNLKELWENKRNRREFLTWIFVFTLIVAAIWAIVMTEIIVWCVNKSQWYDYYMKFVHDNNNFNKSDLNIFWNDKLIFLCTSFVLITIVFYSIINSIINCFKNKNFRYISLLPTAFFFLQCVFSIFSIIFEAIRGENIIDTFNVSWVYVAEFALLFVYPCVWFFVSRNVSLIRSIAFQLEMRERLKEQGIWQDDRQSNNQSNESNDYINSNDSFYIRMKSLSRDQINEIAKTLSISGYESMSDEELIKIIYDIRNIQNKDSIEKEAQIHEDNENDEDKKIN